MLRALVLLALTADGGLVLPTFHQRERLTDYPFDRLNVEGNPVVALELELDKHALKKLHVRDQRTSRATTPNVWLIALRAADSEAAEALSKQVDQLFPEAPYYRKTSITGPWLLVTGFPGTKPVSPEMEAARTTFLTSWAGHE